VGWNNQKVVNNVTMVDIQSSVVTEQLVLQFNIVRSHHSFSVHKLSSL